MTEMTGAEFFKKYLNTTYDLIEYAQSKIDEEDENWNELERVLDTLNDFIQLRTTILLKEGED